MEASRCVSVSCSILETLGEIIFNVSFDCGYLTMLHTLFFISGWRDMFEFMNCANAPRCRCTGREEFGASLASNLNEEFWKLRARSLGDNFIKKNSEVFEAFLAFRDLCFCYLPLPMQRPTLRRQTLSQQHFAVITSVFIVSELWELKKMRTQFNIVLKNKWNINVLDILDL